MAKTPEGELKAKMVKYLLGVGGMVEPLMTGLTGAGRRRYSTPTRSLGRADILWLFRGIVIAVEVKFGTVQRPSQKLWQTRWEAHGGTYWLVDSMEGLMERVTQFLNR